MNKKTCDNCANYAGVPSNTEHWLHVSGSSTTCKTDKGIIVECASTPFWVGLKLNTANWTPITAEAYALQQTPKPKEPVTRYWRHRNTDSTYYCKTLENRIVETISKGNVVRPTDAIHWPDCWTQVSKETYEAQIQKPKEPVIKYWTWHNDPALACKTIDDRIVECNVTDRDFIGEKILGCCWYQCNENRYRTLTETKKPVVEYWRSNRVYGMVCTTTNRIITAGSPHLGSIGERLNSEYWTQTTEADYLKHVQPKPKEVAVHQTPLDDRIKAWHAVWDRCMSLGLTSIGGDTGVARVLNFIQNLHDEGAQKVEEYKRSSIHGQAKAWLEVYMLCNSLGMSTVSLNGLTSVKDFIKSQNEKAKKYDELKKVLST